MEPSKTLIVYYSKTGTTDRIAGITQTLTEAVTRRLSDPTPIAEKILSLVSESNNQSGKGVEEFDPIVLLTPIRNGDPSLSLMEFLGDINLRGKRVLVGLVGANEANPKAMGRLTEKAIEKGCIFIDSIQLRGVWPGGAWSDLKEEDFTREAAKLAEK